MSRLVLASWLGVAVCIAPMAASAAEPEVDVTLEAAPTRARVGELIRLEVRVQVRGGSIDGLELKDLKNYPELEIVSHQTMRPMQFSFGFGSGVRVESSLTHVYTLRANAAGEYTFSPAIAKVDDKTYQSEPLTIVVRASAEMAEPPLDEPDTDVAELSGARFDEQAFVRTVVEPEQAYVGQQVNVTVYLYTRLRLGPQSVAPTKPVMDGFWVYDDPITRLEAQTVSVGGRRYQAYVLHRSVAFPQRSGRLTIGAPKVAFEVAGVSFFDPRERVERVGIPVVVDVQPLPEPIPQRAVVGRYELKASLDRGSVQTGDAVTLRVNASGVGNVQDLRIELPPIVGVRALQPAIRDKQDFVDGKLAGTRSFEWILIPEVPGQHAIPSIELDYFDPETRQYGTTTTTPLAFEAGGAPKAPGPAIEPPAPRPEAPRTFGPIGMYSALRRGEIPVRSRGWFAWALGIPPLGFALLVLTVTVRRRKERRSTMPTAVQRKLVRRAGEALRGEDPRAFYDRVVAAITHALEVQLGEPVTGLPQSELRARLTKAGFEDDLTGRVLNELEGADFARFAASGVDREEMERCLQRTETIIERIERQKGAS